MRTIFAIDSGGHDGRIIAVFEDRATAEAWLAAMTSPTSTTRDYDDPEIQEIVCVQNGDAPTLNTWYCMGIELPDGGEPHHAREWVYSNWACDDKFAGLSEHVRYWRTVSDRGGSLIVRARTHERSAELLDAKVAAWRAGTWGGAGHAEIIETKPL